MPLKIAHRGASGYISENTLEAIERAVQMGVDMVEVDVRIIKSGEAVVFHDETLDRLTTQTGPIKDYIYDDIKRIEVQENFAIPTLGEVLRLLHNRCKLNIEIKDSGSYRIVQEAIYKNRWLHKDLEISSFKWEELREYKCAFPEISVCVLVDNPTLIRDAVKLAEKLNAKSINIEYKILNKKLVSELKKTGFKIYTWTVNHSKDIKKVTEMGVDGIISDYVDRIL